MPAHICCKNTPLHTRLKLVLIIKVEVVDKVALLSHEHLPTLSKVKLFLRSYLSMLLEAEGLFLNVPWVGEAIVFEVVTNASHDNGNAIERAQSCFDSQARL